MSKLLTILEESGAPCYQNDKIKIFLLDWKTYKKAHWNNAKLEEVETAYVEVVQFDLARHAETGSHEVKQVYGVDPDEAYLNGPRFYNKKILLREFK